MFPFWCCCDCGVKKHVRIEFVSDNFYSPLSLSELALSAKIETRDKFLNYINSHGSDWFCESISNEWTLIHPDYKNPSGSSTCINNSVVGQNGDFVYFNQFLYMHDYNFNPLTQRYDANFNFYTYNIYFLEV